MIVVDAVVVTIVVIVVLDVDVSVVNVVVRVIVVDVDVLVVTGVVFVVVLVLRVWRRYCRRRCCGGDHQCGCCERCRVEAATVVLRVSNYNCMAIDRCTSGENILYVFTRRGNARMRTRSHKLRWNQYLPDKAE